MYKPAMVLLVAEMIRASALHGEDGMFKSPARQSSVVNLKQEVTILLTNAQQQV